MIEEDDSQKLDRRIQFIEGFIAGINDQLKALQRKVNGGKMKNSDSHVNVYYEEKPYIGYCPKCAVLADYHNSEGLSCPVCRGKEISIFEYNGEGPSPE